MAKLKAMASRLGSASSRLKPMPKTAEPFYRSAAWRAHVARRKLDHDYFAARARAKPGERLILDHVHERKDGGDDFGLTEWLTFSEHQRKTARKRKERAVG